MSNKINFFALGLAILTFTSCATSKKVKTLENERMSMQSAMETCKKDKDKLTADLAQIQMELAKTKEIAETEKMELAAIKTFLKKEEAKIQKMRKELRAAFASYDKNAIRLEDRDGRLVVVMQNKILYQPGRANIDTEGQTAIETISQVFKANKGLNILVESHTDDKQINNAKFKDNWDLSVARSVTVVRLLEKYGVNPTRLTAAGRGEFVPAKRIASISAETDMANRRTEFIITPKTAALYTLLNEL